MPSTPSFSFATSRRSLLPVIVVVTMSLALLGGFLFDTARLGQPTPATPVEART